MKLPLLHDIAAELGVVESAVAASLAQTTAAKAEALEQLLALLLARFAAYSPRATDGLTILRQEPANRRYFALAKVFMIADQTAEPACFDLALNVTGSVVTGRIHFGLRGGRLPRGINSRSKLETALLAYPHETVAAIDWELRFERRADATWTLC